MRAPDAEVGWVTVLERVKDRQRDPANKQDLNHLMAPGNGSETAQTKNGQSCVSQDWIIVLEGPWSTFDLLAWSTPEP